MRRIAPFAVLAMLAAGAASAGQVYGTITQGGQAAGGAEITISCDDAGHACATDERGSYSLHVPKSGRCTLQLTYAGREGGTDVYAYDEAVRYDFDLAAASDGSWTLNRR